jgi:predicted amidohydrolase
MPSKLDISLIQLCSGPDVEENIATASALIKEAAATGARLILTPENTALFEAHTKALFGKAEPEDQNKALKVFTRLASDLNVWLLIGSLAIKLSGQKLANRSFLISPQGIIARYDKIHMFDVNLKGGESYRESKNFQAGSKAVVGETSWGPLGMTVCYDLRFPYLYRRLAHKGAGMIAVPSSFTAQTGRAHWHILLRARAIEVGAFILAPAQGGRHADGRETFGHSLVVDPWGKVLLDAGDIESGAFNITLDLTKIEKARAAIPALKHDRELDT